MKVSGDKSEMEAFKMTGYRQERNLKYSFDFDVNMKTFQKTENSFPFEFNYEKIKIDVDSDGKKDNKLLSLSEIIISGDLRNGKEIITRISKSGNATKDNFINSLPKEFLRQVVSKNGMKIGDQIIVKKAVESTGDNFKMTGTFLYTLKEIEEKVAYFDLAIELKNDKSSSMNISGIGEGKMIYNHIDHYVISENSTSKIEASQIEKTFKIEVKNTIKSLYSIQFTE